jgi:putative membrane protein
MTAPDGLLHASAPHWSFEPITIALLASSTVVYSAGLSRLWSRAGRDRGIRWFEAASFFSGMAILALGLLSPIGWLATILFSVHMTQHEILMLVGAPLLVLGRALHVFLWALPKHGRETIGRLTQQYLFARVWRTMSSPAVVFAIHGIVLWVWHVPAFFNAALASEVVHACQHVSFIATAALFWWSMVHGRYGAIGYGVAIVYVFLTGLHSSLLGALITLSSRVWYVPYVESASLWDVNALDDQQLAGLIMWIPTGAVFIVFGLALLAAWLGASEKRARIGSVGPPFAG